VESVLKAPPMTSRRSRGRPRTWVPRATAALGTFRPARSSPGRIPRFPGWAAFTGSSPGVRQSAARHRAQLARIPGGHL